MKQCSGGFTPIHPYVGSGEIDVILVTLFHSAGKDEELCFADIGEGDLNQ